MSNNTRGVIEIAMRGLPEHRREVFQFLMNCGVVNLEWYLRTKIVGVAEAERNDHMRVLKYAYAFCLAGAEVTLLRESSVESEKTPDLEVEIPGTRFFVEVKKFREGSARDPVSKIVQAVTFKRDQLPSAEVGLVAIDNFDVRLELGTEGVISHEHVMNALCELQSLTDRHPKGWEKPGGVIFAASSIPQLPPPGIPPMLLMPHFIWLNERSSNPVRGEVVNFLVDTLNRAQVIDPRVVCKEAATSTGQKHHSPRT